MDEGQRPVKAVLWDMDGTLVDSEPLHRRSFELILAEFGLAVPAGFHAATIGKSERETYRWFRQTVGMTVDYDDWVAARYRQYLNHIAQVTPLQAAISLWRTLEQGGIAQAIVSNSDRMIVDANVRLSGLLRPGLVTVSRNDVREGKPDAEPYLRAAWLLGVEPAHAAVVEDSVTGLRAGQNAGMQIFYTPDLHGAPIEGSRPVAELRAIAVGKPTAMK